MSDSLATALGWGICAIALFSYLSISAWSKAQREEREAYFKNEAIKKIAEMQGAASEPVLQLLRQAVATWKEKEEPAPWTMMASQAKPYYRAQAVKKIAESPDGGAAVIEFLREEDRASAGRTRAGLRLGGLIASAVGVGLMLFLRELLPDQGVYMCGVIPLLAGLSVFIYSFFSGTGE